MRKILKHLYQLSRHLMIYTALMRLLSALFLKCAYSHPCLSSIMPCQRVSENQRSKCFRWPSLCDQASFSRCFRHLCSMYGLHQKNAWWLKMNSQAECNTSLWTIFWSLRHSETWYNFKCRKDPNPLLKRPSENKSQSLKTKLRLR